MFRFIFVSIPKLLLFQLPLFVINVAFFVPRLFIKITFYRNMRLWIHVGLTDADNNFLNWLNAEINTGATKIRVPAELVSDVSKAGIREAKRLCKLTGVGLSL